MKRKDVPQDHSKTYGGHRRVLYAVNERDRYVPATSDGWDTEEFVTNMAVEHFHELAAEARRRVLSGQSSPLEFHMYDHRMDMVGLAQATGIPRWRIRRHLRPEIFAKLPRRVLARYADATGLGMDDLKALPPGDDR
jgi:hypothetical protein